ncbi:glutamate decarboxylase eukaryotic type [Photobacterium aphoticum]|uniref:Glutamate decarboxylase eukaryotic type n=1 Tax=Photobacterium aphoticum TaxID=754436 RepID=A0A090QW98_9GAMM|nr:glutamate decarboxylase eukaryotic type [Photobacterium aphoticum]
MKHYGYEDLAVLVSERGHYSLKKAADVLGIGRDSLIPIKTDNNNRVVVSEMKAKLDELKAKNIKPFAIIGVAGTTETGTIDPLSELADLAHAYGCHFHVDAAWGGATLMSKKYRHLLNGIERADSVTIDAHKQLYVPMGAGMVIFKNPELMTSIEHHAEYILRKGSKDLGSHTLEGSRSGMAMLLYASLNIISRQGYEMLINNSIEKAQYFAGLIEAHPEFELVTHPELCLLTYRYVPARTQQALTLATADERETLLAALDDLTQFIQKRQRESGKSFVSRTRITPERWDRRLTTVFRVVLANPLTTENILQEVLAEQVEIAKQSFISSPQIRTLTNRILTRHNIA